MFTQRLSKRFFANGGTSLKQLTMRSTSRSGHLLVCPTRALDFEAFDENHQLFQHSLWELLKGHSWLEDHLGLLPLKAMAGPPPPSHPLTHIESGRKKQRAPTMKLALLQQEEAAADAGHSPLCPANSKGAKVTVIEFNATKSALELLPDPSM